MDFERTKREDQKGQTRLNHPKAGIGYAYVTSQVGISLTGDPRDLALRNALYAIIQPAQRP